MAVVRKMWSNFIWRKPWFVW